MYTPVDAQIKSGLKCPVSTVGSQSTVYTVLLLWTILIQRERRLGGEEVVEGSHDDRGQLAWGGGARGGGCRCSTALFPLGLGYGELPSFTLIKKSRTPPLLLPCG